MRGKDHLFHLIHSLSKSEKRYFTLDARKGGKTNSRYLELFQRINKQEKYEEVSLKKKFGARLGDDKARLYEAILGSMREYQSKKSYKIRIKELLTDAKILFERKLYDQSENRLNEAKELALELQDHLAVLEINLQQRQRMKEYQAKNYEKQVEELIQEKNEQLKIIEQEFWLNDFYDRLFVEFMKSTQKLNDKRIKEITITYKPVLRKDTKDLIPSLHSNRRYHQIKALYYRLTGNRNNVLLQFQKTVDLWKLYPINFKEEFFIYIGDFINLIAATSSSTDKFDLLPALIKELKSYSTPNIQSEKLIFEKTSIYELIFLLNKPRQLIDLTINETETGLKKHRINPSSEFSILFNAAVLLFLNDRFQSCIKWLEKIWILQRRNKNIRKDIHNDSRILYLMSIQKIGTFEQIENSLRSTNRYFKQNKDSKLLNFYSLYATTLKKLQEANSSREEKDILYCLKQEIINQFKNKIHAGLDEISLLWIESLLQNKKISKLRLASLKEKTSLNK